MIAQGLNIEQKRSCGIDLNLLMTFAVIYREANVTNAARCLSVGQPAVSNSLAKLRRYFNDPLFTHGYRKMSPTPMAVKLAHGILPALERVQETLLAITDADVQR